MKTSQEQLDQQKWFLLLHYHMMRSPIHTVKKTTRYKPGTSPSESHSEKLTES
jgi:phosphatidylserine decarboxylase